MSRRRVLTTIVEIKRRGRRIVLAVFVFGFALVLSSCANGANSKTVESVWGRTSVSKWKDGKTAVYLLSFDDEAPSQLTNVVPELNRRMITGTFYVVPGNELWAATESEWIQAAQSPFVVLANHTFTHLGVTSVAELEDELARCNDVLYGIYSGRPRPFLMSFGRPGGVPWDVTPQEVSDVLARHDLIERPPFRGSPSNYTTLDELVASVDEAIARGGLGYNDMHGVGGDWLETPTEWFIALLDKLEAERDRVWVPDVISYDKYVAERLATQVQHISASANEIRVSLTSALDPMLYDYPLTLVTDVPAGWTRAVVTQANSKVQVSVTDRTVMYEATPGAGEIVVTPS